MIPVSLDCTQWLKIAAAAEAKYAAASAAIRAECEGKTGLLTIEKSYDTWAALDRACGIECYAAKYLTEQVSARVYGGQCERRVQPAKDVVRLAREADAEYSAEGYQRSPVRREATDRPERRDTRKAKTGTSNQRGTRKPKPEVHVKNLGLTQGGLFGDL